MSLRIASNVGSLIAQHSLGKSSGAMSSSLEKLSTGLKVNRGADGPAALVISEKQRAQIAGLEQAIENTEKAEAVIQTAEGAFNEINALLVKVRSLALDSANSGVNDADALAANQAEIDNALSTITRIAESTQFTNKKLLNGDSGVSGTASDADVSFISGTGNTETGTYGVEVTTVAERANVASTVNVTSLAAEETLTINGVDITIAAGEAAADIAGRINDFSTETGVVAVDTGSGIRLQSTEFGEDASISVESTGTGLGFDSSGGPLTDTGEDVVATITQNGQSIGSFTGSGNELTVDSGTAEGLTVSFGEASANSVATVTGDQGTVDVANNALVFQIGANAGQSATYAIGSVSSDSLAAGVGSTFGSLAEINVESADGATASLEVIDAAINEISTKRGELGAFQQNTLNSTVNNLRTSLENSVYAESIIRDTDFASEIAEFTKQQVLVQAGTSLLGSANQSSQLILGLL